MHNEQREQFEKWLRTVCFQQPTPEAYDLAWEAWQAAQQSVQSDDCPSCAGSGKKEIGGMLLTCLACDGTGNRR